MEESRPPRLYDLLDSFLVDECDLTYTDHIAYRTYWIRPYRYGEIEWVCDVYEDRVNVRRSGYFQATDPNFMSKLRNAVHKACSL